MPDRVLAAAAELPYRVFAQTRLLTTEEAAARLRLSVYTLRNWRRPGYAAAPDLPIVRVGRQVRYREADIEAFLARQRVSA